MIRKLVIATVAMLGGCGESPPVPHVDGATIAYAVQQAQARADKARAAVGDGAGPAEAGK